VDRGGGFSREVVERGGVAGGVRVARCIKRIFLRRRGGIESLEMRGKEKHQTGISEGDGASVRS
jgi:hypothetical protein